MVHRCGCIEMEYRLGQWGLGVLAPEEVARST